MPRIWSGTVRVLLITLVPASAGNAQAEDGAMALLQTSTALHPKPATARRPVFTSWPSGRGELGQYGCSSSLSAPFELNLTWRWHHPLGRFHTGPIGTAIDGEGNIYLSGGDAIRKFGPQGHVQWKHERLPANVPNIASLYDGKVYSSDSRGRVFALSMRTGKEIWSRKVCKTIAVDNGFVMVSEGVVVVSTDAILRLKNRVVRGLNATDGSPLWAFTPDVNVRHFMASFPGDGTTLFQDQSGKAYRLRLADGALLWKEGGMPGSRTGGTATLGANGVLYTVHGNEPPTAAEDQDAPGMLVARRVVDGMELWSRVTPEPPNNAPAVGYVYGHVGLTVVQPTGRRAGQFARTDVLAYDAATGAARWVFHGPAQEGLLQAGDAEGLLERAASGVPPACVPNPWSAPTIDANGTVFVGNQNGHFFALRDLNGDGLIEGVGEVSSFDALAAFAGSAGPSLAPGRVAVASCDSLFVFGGDRVP